MPDPVEGGAECFSGTGDPLGVGAEEGLSGGIASEGETPAGEAKILGISAGGGASALGIAESEPDSPGLSGSTSAGSMKVGEVAGRSRTAAG